MKIRTKQGETKNTPFSIDRILSNSKKVAAKFPKESLESCTINKKSKSKLEGQAMLFYQRRNLWEWRP